MATINSVIDAISSADLSPTEHSFLKHFIQQAIEPEVAAQYIQSIINTRSTDVENSLRQFKRNWRKLTNRLMTIEPIPKRLDALVRGRDGPYCTMTTFQENETRPAPSLVESAHVIPPSFLQGIETAEGGCLLPILEAFLSKSSVDQLRTLLSDNVQDNARSLQNMWLLTPSMHKAFRAGHIEIRKFDSESTETSQTDMYRVWGQSPEKPRDLYFGNGLRLSGSVVESFHISTTNSKEVPLPSDILFDIYRRFSDALHLFSIEDKINRGWPKPPSMILQKLFGFPISIFKRAFHRLWLWAPVSIRLRCYRHLWKIGQRLYGIEGGQWFHRVQRLPFGLYMKKAEGASWNESNALNMIERYTSIPAPRSVDVVEDPSQDTTYLLMTRLHGESFKNSVHLMSYPERDQFFDDLGKCISQLRKIPNTTSYIYSDTLGGPMYDHLIPNRVGGPFNSDFDLMTYVYSEVGGGLSLAELYEGEENIPNGNRSFFTHSDLHFSNILVDQGRFCGIIDWECAGFKPDFWEFTHASFGVWGRKEEMSWWRRIFGNQYDEILKKEEARWRCNPIF